MTEESLQYQIKNSENLTEVITWSLENKELWNKLCYSLTDKMTIEDMGTLIDECKQHGFMELYYLLLAKVGSIIEISISDPRFINFIKAGLDKDVTLDMERLNNL